MWPFAWLKAELFYKNKRVGPACAKRDELNKFANNLVRSLLLYDKMQNFWIPIFLNFKKSNKFNEFDNESCAFRLIDFGISRGLNSF